MKRIKTAILLRGSGRGDYGLQQEARRSGIRHVADRHAARHTRQWLQHRIPLCHDRQCRKIGSAGGHRKANIEYFFELEEFAGTAREAADSAILQVAAEIVLPEGMSQGMGAYEISVESEGSVQDTLVTYSISRWSFTGGAHCMYNIEYHTYSITDGYELSLADLFTAPQLLGMEKLLREKLYTQYGTDNDEGLAEQGFFPEYIALTENFQITPEGITFYYNPYAIGCYALGAVEVAIGREELEQF